MCHELDRGQIEEIIKRYSLKFSEDGELNKMRADDFYTLIYYIEKLSKENRGLKNEIEKLIGRIHFITSV